MMLEAKAIMDLMSEDDFDQAKARERLDAFNRISDEAHAKVADQEPGKLDWEASSVGREFPSRRQGAAAARQREKPYTDFERRMLDSPSMAPRGSASKLMQEYNTLVFQSNRQ
jgi:hypothetical protein